MSGAAEAAPPRPRRARPPTRRYEARRRAILAAAVEELNQNGVRGMTLGEVAARLDLVPTSLIYYFQNKEQLAEACFESAIDRFHELIAAGEASGDDDRARLGGFVRAHFDFRRQVATGAAEQIVVFNDIRALRSRRVGDAYVQLFRHARGLLAGAPGRPLPLLDRNARTRLLLAQVYWAPMWMTRSEPQDYPWLAGRLIDLLHDGMMAPGVAWPQLGAPSRVAAAAEGDSAAELFLQAATALINEEGYHGASVERISGRLNVSKGAFYHHHETKDELVAACFERTFQIMWRAIRAAEAEGGSGLKVLAQISAALVRRQLDGPLQLLRTSALTALPESIRPGLVAQFDRISGRFAAIICDGVADGSLRPVDVNIAAQMVTAMINAAAVLRYWAPGLSGESVVDGYVRPLFEGLLSPTPA